MGFIKKWWQIRQAEKCRRVGHHLAEYFCVGYRCPSEKSWAVADHIETVSVECKRCRAMPSIKRTTTVLASYAKLTMPSEDMLALKRDGWLWREEGWRKIQDTPTNKDSGEAHRGE